MSQERRPTYLVIAAEASADLHGARVIDAIRARIPEARFVGVGGDACVEAGAILTAHARELGLMGFSDVLYALPRVLGILRRCVELSATEQVDAALLIDAPDFNLRLAKKLHAQGIPVIYFISPKLWATRPWRVKVVQRYVHRMLVIFPFEVEFYQQHGVNVEYVGNPVVEQMADRYDRASARALLKISSTARVVAMLPGSRKGEISRIAPTLGLAARSLADEDGIEVLVPRATTIDRATLEQALGDVAAVHIVEGRAREVLAAADCAVVAAGTATLEAALVDVPTVMVYRVSWLTWIIYRLFLLRIPYISLINIIAGRFVIRELWQKALTPAAVVAEVRRVLNGQERARMLEAYAEIRQQLGRRDTAARVAAVVIEASARKQEIAHDAPRALLESKRSK